MKLHAVLLFPLVLLLAACGEAGSDELSGYVEADLVYLSSEEAGTIEALAVREGDAIAPGAEVFRLEARRLAPQLARAEAAAAAARARRDDLLTGARPDEMAVRDNAVREADAALRLAEEDLARAEMLFKQGHISAARSDQARAARDAAKARLEAQRAEVRRAALPGRSAAIVAAEEEVKAAEADLDLMRMRLADLTVAAPAAGTVEQLYHYPGETVAAGVPVAALLPDGGLKVRFFAPQSLLPRLPLGGSVTVICDGCESPIEARITFIDREPQFTPPVIFSREEREKLVFLVEAVPEDPRPLTPGAPVSIRSGP